MRLWNKSDWLKNLVFEIWRDLFGYKFILCCWLLTKTKPYVYNLLNKSFLVAKIQNLSGVFHGLVTSRIYFQF